MKKKDVILKLLQEKFEAEENSARVIRAMLESKDAAERRYGLEHARREAVENELANLRENGVTVAPGYQVTTYHTNADGLRAGIITDTRTGKQYGFESVPKPE